MGSPGGTDTISPVEQAVWLVFCLICLHLAFLWPYHIIFPGQRTNLFSGTLCAVALCAALTVALKRSVLTSPTEILISVGLPGLAVLSAWGNAGSEDAVWRLFILMASGLGGFWSARILLNTPFRQQVFAWLCLGCLVAVSALSLRDYLESGAVDYFLYSRSHPLIQMLFLLSAGPIALLSRRHSLQSLLGVLVLVGMYVTLYLIGVDDTRSAVLIPMAILALFAIMASFGSRLVPAAFVLLLVVSCVTAHYSSTLTNRGLGQYQEYRLESYPFSWHIAQKYPALGIGLRTSREGFIEDYRVVQPDYPEHVFVREVRYLITSENIFLTLMVGVGLPFLILYGAVLISLLGRLVRMVFRPPEDTVFHPLALLLPLAASLLHSLTTDALLYPQINWYFHVILGLIPCRPAYAPEVTLSWRTVGVRAAMAAAVVTLGVFLGSYQAFFLERSGAKESPASAPSSPVAAKVSRAGDGNERGGTDNQPKNTQTTESAGTLVVSIDSYEGSPINWRVMLIVDNSYSMVAEQPPWLPNRAQAASDFVMGLARVLPHTAKVAVRDFSSQAVCRKGDWAIPLRVSRLLCPWDEAPFDTLGSVVSQIDAAGKNSLCNAAANSAIMDFQSLEGCSGRLLLVTDGTYPCSWTRAEGLMRDLSAQQGLAVDVLAVGMTQGHEEPYRTLAHMTHGEFMRVTNPSDVARALHRYGTALRRMLPTAIELRGFTGQYRVFPGEEISLPAGPYSLILPPMDGLEPSKRRIARKVRITSQERTTVRISVVDGEPVVR